jgi:diguanylate cyclase (GGDEF)-like protein
MSIELTVFQNLNHFAIVFANNKHMQLRYISMLCAILIALLSYELIAEWELHTPTLMIVVSVLALSVAFSVYVMLGYRRFYEDPDTVQRDSQKLQAGYDELERMYHQSSLLREMITLLQSSKTIEEACKIIAVFAKQLFPETAGMVFMTDYHGVWLSMGHWHSSNVKPISFIDQDCWAVRSNLIYEVINPGEKPLCPHVHKLLNVHYPHFCMPIDKQGQVHGILFVEVIEPRIRNVAYEDLKQAIAAFTEQITPALTNIELNYQLRRQSLSDELTGLYNRRYFLSALANEIARSKRQKKSFSLVMIDVDHFKRYNDTYGHEAGDRILQKFADILRAQFRESDILCRYGGEEFIILLPEAGIEDAKKRCEQLLESVRNELFLPSLPKSKPVTISMGISTYPKHSRNPEQLIDKSDKALYEAKASGRNQIKIYG